VVKTCTSWDGNMRPYYHFTSLDAFCKILKTGKIRLTPCNLAKNAAVETMSLYSSVKNIIDNDAILNNKLLKHYKLSNTEDLINHIIDQRNKSYMICFSMFGNGNESDEISKASYMWKFYADNSKGVAIKFNYKCFPYMEHGSKGEIDAIGNTIRSSELRIDHAIYDENRLKKFLDDFHDMHLFATDVYKPNFCELENEIRFLIYVHNKADLYGLNGVSVSEIDTSEFPKYLYYDFASLETFNNGRGIEKIFCREQKTYSEVCDIAGKNLVELIS
jgi:hypothetical protein